MFVQNAKARLLAAVVFAVALPAALAAQVPQTIVIDGVNDFDPSNLLDADGGDTQYTPIDIGDFYVTNDATTLYVGFQQDKDGWGQVQLGIAIDVGTADGGTTDPWGRQLEWSLATDKPDFMFYVNLDNNYQAAYYWDGAAWAALGSAGTDALGWVAGNGFSELGVLLGSLGVSAGAAIHVEAWTTQDSPTKGPLDAVANDASQLSTPGSTTFDVTSPIPMFDYIAYTVQSAVDNTPPQVVSAKRAAAAQVDVTFNEPVDQTTAEVAGNYSVTGATVSSATRDGATTNVVHLTLAADIGASASMYTVTVANVQDLAGNPVGASDSACFALKSVLFRGRMSYFLDSQTPPYGGFTVEGGTLPLTWSLCDGADGVDTGGGVYEYTGLFSIPGDCGAGTASETVEWKWVYDCSTYEPLASNRMATLDLAGGANDTIDVWWDDQDPTQFTTHDIDVLFYVDANELSPTPADSISINGAVAPLNWNIPPELQMVDDGTGIDDTAGDGIYSLLVTFPAGSLKNVGYKFVHDSTYECLTQNDRNVYLNDELYDTVGGTLGPLTLPVVHYDACDVTWRPVEVVFSVDTTQGMSPLPGGAVVSVNGTPSNSVTPSFSWDVPSLNDLADDGVAPDATAGDGIYTCSVVFADSSQIQTDYKYLVDDVYECPDQGNRSFTVDADNHDDAGNPQVLPLDVLHQCQTTAVDQPAPRRSLLEQNHPNPFNPQTEIRFTVNRAGPGSLQVFNTKGELVRTLLRGRLGTGPHAVTWNGRDDAGRPASAGIYFYRLTVNGDVGVRKMMLIK